jgi:hypothetical protein
MRGGWALFTFLLPLGLGGCVERWLNIKSEPPGAEVFLDGALIGKTPLRTPFEYYGDREITIRLEKYETVRKIEGVHAPWWQIFPFDFVTDVMLPFHFEDEREFSYTLVPLGPPESPEKVERRAQELRDKLQKKP